MPTRSSQTQARPFDCVFLIIFPEFLNEKQVSYLRFLSQTLGFCQVLLEAHKSQVISPLNGIFSSRDKVSSFQISVLETHFNKNKITITVCLKLLDFAQKKGSEQFDREYFAMKNRLIFFFPASAKNYRTIHEMKAREIGFKRLARSNRQKSSRQKEVQDRRQSFKIEQNYVKKNNNINITSSDKSIMNLNNRIVVLAVLIFCACAFSNLTYSFLNGANDVYKVPGYSLGTLTAGFKLEVNLNIPYVITPPVALNALRIQVLNFNKTVVESNSVPFSPASCVAGSVKCTLLWPIPRTGIFFLKVFSTSSQTSIQFFTLDAKTYNASIVHTDPSQTIQLLKLTEVIRRDLMKLMYLSQAKKKVDIRLFSVPRKPGSNPIVGAVGFYFSLYYIGATLPRNRFVATNPDLFRPYDYSYDIKNEIETYTITLNKVGYYSIIFLLNPTNKGMKVQYPSDPYLCPHMPDYPDFYSNFQGCIPQAKSDGELPCATYDPVIGICEACLDKYILVDGACIANTTCPDRQYFHFGSCLNVSTLCGTYDSFTGLCSTCATPADYDLVNGTCVHKVVVCGVRQYQKNYICYNVDVGCGDFDPLTGNCVNCAGIEFELIAGKCPARVVVCPAGQYVLNFACATIPVECLNFDTTKNICLACLQGYYTEGGVCKRIICPPGQVPSRFGIFCTNVSPLCDNYDDVTGRCLSCKNPNHKVNANGACAQYTSPLAGCSERQRLGFGACLHAEVNCYAYNLVTGNCDQCEKGFYLDYTGRCAKDAVCGRGQWSVNGECIGFHENCLKINEVGLCSQCVNKLYRLQQGRCVFVKSCLENQYLNALGECVDVSANCATFNPTNGECVTCKAADVHPSSGVCCAAGQIFSSGVCVDSVALQQSYQNSAGPSCLLVHPSLGNCLKCNPGYEPDQTVTSQCAPI